MTELEAIQARKNQALKAIRKIYHPLYKFPYDHSYSFRDDEDNESYAEQREYVIKDIIEELNRDIKNIKAQFKEKARKKSLQELRAKQQKGIL